MMPGSTALASSPALALQMRAAEGALALAQIHTHDEHIHTETLTLAAPLLDRRTEARLKGYEGDMCGECGNYTMVRNGTCLKCETCGSTSGCS
jgi:ribonucleoside-diphosphate reductase alpha chain